MASGFSQRMLAGAAITIVASAPAGSAPPVPADAWTIDYSENPVCDHRDPASAVEIRVKS